MLCQREIDLAYLGGLIDGEGYIGLAKNGKASRIGERYNPRFTITNTNPLMVEDVRRILLNEDIPFYVSEWDGNSEHKHRYTIEAVGFRRVLKALFVLEPWIRIKRPQAQIVLAFIWSRINHGTAYRHTPYTTDERLFCEACGELNAKGSVILREHTPRAAEIAAKMCSELRAKGAEAAEMSARLSRGKGWIRS